MKIDWFAKILLLVIAISLVVIALRPYIAPRVALAQSSNPHALYIEPGVFMLHAPDSSHNEFGRIVVDLRNGNVWGFPTTTQDPYPTAKANTAPPTSHPFLLARLALEDTDK